MCAINPEGFGKCSIVSSEIYGIETLFIRIFHGITYQKINGVVTIFFLCIGNTVLGEIHPDCLIASWDRVSQESCPIPDTTGDIEDLSWFWLVSGEIISFNMGVQRLLPCDFSRLDEFRD